MAVHGWTLKSITQLKTGFAIGTLAENLLDKRNPLLSVDLSCPV